MFDVTKPMCVRVDIGKPESEQHVVKIYETDAPGDYPIKGCLISADGNSSDIHEWTREGKYSTAPKDKYGYDLFNIPLKQVVCVYLFKDSQGKLSVSLRKGKASERIASQLVEFVEGEFNKPAEK